MYQALYRKYRPSTFSEVVGQEHITETLKHQLDTGKIFHAYLFTGTRGTGKTSCAKILAKAVNCENLKNGDPCCECESCKQIADGEVMDISEIDAASNNGVDNIRALRDQANFTPAKAKYRVYIIDEVHMLSIGAFNALLKTLEEPPAHVVFILATTEVHKLPATIISRCERFDFKRIDTDNIVKRLEHVCEQEKIDFTDEALRLIASLADGGMRDALSILDLCAAADGKVTEERVFTTCGLSGKEKLFEITDKIAEHDAAGAVGIVEEVHASSSTVSRFLSELSSHLRDVMIVKTMPSPRPVVATAAEEKRLEAQGAKFTFEELLNALEILRNSTASLSAGDAKTLAEMTVIRLCRPDLLNGLTALEARLAALETKINSGDFSVSSKTKETETKPIVTEKPVEVQEKTPEITKEDTAEELPIPTEPDSSETEETPFKQWGALLDEVRITCPLIVGVLEGSRAYTKGDMLLIDCDNTQFRSMLNANDKYRKDIKAAALKLTGKSFRLGPYEKKAETKKTEEDPLRAFAKKLDILSNEIK